MTHRTRNSYLSKVMARVERGLIVKALRRHEGRVVLVAAELGVNRTDIYKRMRVLGLEPKMKRREGNAAWQALGDYTS